MLSVGTIFNPKEYRETRKRKEKEKFIYSIISISMYSKDIYFILWVKMQYYIWGSTTSIEN